MERVWKPSVEISPNCPRCGSSNTKFCYYNNYSLTQPRYFCKGCRRYWTKGGSLRNVPVGGGCRKTRRGNNKTGPVHTKPGNFPYGATTNSTGPGGSIGHYGHVNAGSNTTNGTFLENGSHIDLALVYANFLSPKPDLSKANNNGSNGSEIHIPELGSDDFDPSLEFQNPNHHDDHHMINHEQIFFCGLDSFQKQYDQDRGDQENCSGDFGILPPLPGQEALWSSSHEMMVSQAMEASQELPLMVIPEAQDHHHQHHQEENLLTGNCWSPFDLPSDHDTFSGSS